jgi:hypothetical protein
MFKFRGSYYQMRGIVTCLESVTVLGIIPVMAPFRYDSEMLL